MADAAFFRIESETNFSRMDPEILNFPKTSNVAMSHKLQISTFISFDFSSSFMIDRQWGLEEAVRD